ncbi:MAG TPA: hypothetical protein VHR72_12965, partial [Gemmataceae bacterium]|nr:hypothetical protein [Gemmataceae bacterium]
TNLKLPLVGAAPEMPFPPITLDIVERMLGAIQDDGLPQRLLDRGVSRADGLRFPLILATALLFLYGLKKLFGVRLHRPLPGTPYLLGVQSAPHRPLIAQRMLDVAKRRRFDEPARALAESWFREIAGIEPQGGGKIAYELRAGLPERHRLSKRIDEMWNLATGVERGRVDRGRLLAVAETLDDLGAALRRGELTIAPR